MSAVIHAGSPFLYSWLWTKSSTGAEKAFVNPVIKSVQLWGRIVKLIKYEFNPMKLREICGFSSKSSPISAATAQNEV